MRILVATDAFRPQVNGVVRSLEALAATLPSLGSTIDFVSPIGFKTVPLPTYGEIPLALTGAAGFAKRVTVLEKQSGPFDHIHIATEGPIGWAARRFCRQRRRLFTTSYHTRFPEYVAARSPIPLALTYRLLRWFHNAGSGTMVSTPSLATELEGRGFERLMRWSRGVDGQHFHPAKRSEPALPRPVFLYAGRLAPEKNIEAFLKLELPGSKLVVGGGPSAAALRATYPRAHFAGACFGDDLARHYASADVFVFPSHTDTFGIVLLEAMASGLPVAAFPVPGPLDVVGTSGAGCLDWDLRRACLRALDIPRESARNHAERFDWTASAQQFLTNIAAARAGAGVAPLPSGEQDELLIQRELVELG